MTLIIGALLMTLSPAPIAEKSIEPVEPETMARWLEATEYIDKNHPRIRGLALQLTEDVVGDREKAVAIFRYVRDRVAFGWAGAFYDMKASETVAAGKGYCQTKTTLFLALLRAARIPARAVFVDIDAEVLRGLTRPPGPYVDHVYAEVWLDGRWVRTDSYIVDQPLFERAVAKLRAEDRALGYGVHIDGAIDWDGRNDRFVQFVENDRVPWLNSKKWGVHRDVRAFYQSERGWNKKTLFSRVVFRLFAGAANRAADRLRRQ